MREYKKDINDRMNEFVLTQNVSIGMLTFSTSRKSTGYVYSPQQKIRLTVGEILEVVNQNKMISGKDGFGFGAKIYIEDAQLRDHLGFDKYDENDKLVEAQSTFGVKHIKEKLMTKDEDEFQEFVQSYSKSLFDRHLIFKVSKELGNLSQDRVNYIQNQFRYKN